MLSLEAVGPYKLGDFTIPMVKLRDVGLDTTEHAIPIPMELGVLSDFGFNFMPPVHLGSEHVGDKAEKEQSDDVKFHRENAKADSSAVAD
jgi:hypothetical protein